MKTSECVVFFIWIFATLSGINYFGLDLFLNLKCKQVAIQNLQIDINSALTVLMLGSKVLVPNAKVGRPGNATDKTITSFKDSQCRKIKVILDRASDRASQAASLARLFMVLQDYVAKYSAEEFAGQTHFAFFEDSAAAASVAAAVQADCVGNSASQFLEAAAALQCHAALDSPRPNLAAPNTKDMSEDRGRQMTSAKACELDNLRNVIVAYNKAATRMFLHHSFQLPIVTIPLAAAAFSKSQPYEELRRISPQDSMLRLPFSAMCSRRLTFLSYHTVLCMIAALLHAAAILWVGTALDAQQASSGNDGQDQGKEDDLTVLEACMFLSWTLWQSLISLPRYIIEFADDVLFFVEQDIQLVTHENIVEEIEEGLNMPVISFQRFEVLHRVMMACGIK